jgi:hypothetical protein
MSGQGVIGEVNGSLDMSAASSATSGDISNSINATSGKQSLGFVKILAISGFCWLFLKLWKKK